MIAATVSASMVIACLPTVANADETTQTDVTEQTEITEQTVPTESSEETVVEETIAAEPSCETVTEETQINEDLIEVGTYEDLVATINVRDYEGTIKLIENIRTDDVIRIDAGQMVTLDLNGYALGRTLWETAEDGHVIMVDTGAVFTIQDSCGGGTIDGGNAYKGGGIYNLGYLFMNGVTIKGCQAHNGTDDGKGGGIYNNGNLVINGGSVSCNNGDFGGGIYNDANGTATISNSSITDNNSYQYGGGIVNLGCLSLAGNCSITGNSSAVNGGGIRNEGSLHMSGFNTITNNSSDGVKCNVFLKEGTVISIDDSVSGEIGVFPENPLQTITSGWIASDDVSAIKLDNEYVPMFVDGEVSGRTYYLSRFWDGTRVVTRQMPCPDDIQPVTTTLTSGWYIASQYQEINERIKVESGCEVNLVLADGCRLMCGQGIEVPEGSTLNIYGQENDTGAIFASGCEGAAAIGGSKTAANGVINIYGGTVNAISKFECTSAIGGGDNTSVGERISVYGGEVYAECKQYLGAGIGGGYKCCGPDIYIYGGHVEATSKGFAAGIGGGYESGCPSAIVINGGEVIAHATYEGAAGIGEGYDASDDASASSVITINGGTVEAVGARGGACIGGGKGCNTKITIIINGGIVNARRTDGFDDCAAAGIGAGSGTILENLGGGDFAGSITITGGEVYAEGAGCTKVSHKAGAAGIGAGNNGNMTGTIRIEGGNVTCIGRGGGAPIGAGFDNYFSNGNVTGTISITGGVVRLQDASYNDMSNHPQFVGHGADGDKGGTVIIGDSIKVRYENQTDYYRGGRESFLRGSSDDVVIIETV